MFENRSCAGSRKKLGGECRISFASGKSPGERLQPMASRGWFNRRTARCDERDPQKTEGSRKDALTFDLRAVSAAEHVWVAVGEDAHQLVLEEVPFLSDLV